MPVFNLLQSIGLCFPMGYMQKSEKPQNSAIGFLDSQHRR